MATQGRRLAAAPLFGDVATQGCHNAAASDNEKTQGLCDSDAVVSRYLSSRTRRRTMKRHGHDKLGPIPPSDTLHLRQIRVIFHHACRRKPCAVHDKAPHCHEPCVVHRSASRVRIQHLSRRQPCVSTGSAAMRCSPHTLCDAMRAPLGHALLWRRPPWSRSVPSTSIAACWRYGTNCKQLYSLSSCVSFITHGPCHPPATPALV